MRLREFVDKEKQKLSEVVVAAAPAAIPAWMWIAGALGIGVGVVSQQQIQRMLNDPTGNEYASWKKENPGAIETLPKEVQKQLDKIDREQQAQIKQQATQNRIIAMAQNPDQSVTDKIQGYESGQLVIQGTNSFASQRDANKILATQPEGSVVWILNSDGTYGRYTKTEPKGGVPAWTSSSVAAPGVADTTPPSAPGKGREDGTDRIGPVIGGATGVAGATTVGPGTREKEDPDAGPATGAQPEKGTDAQPETGSDTSGQSAGTVDKPEAGTDAEVGSGEITDIGPDVQSDATTKSGDIGADVSSAAQGADAIPGAKPEVGTDAVPGAIAVPQTKADAIPKVDGAALATTMPPPMPPPPFPVPMGKKMKPSGSFTYSGTRKGRNDPIRVYGAVDDRGTQRPWGQ